MNDYEHIYTKLRKEFGKYCGFDDTDFKCVSIEASTDCYERYVTMNPVNFRFDNIPEMGEHSVNTKRIPIANRGQLHEEGGWPKEIDYSEAQDTAKWRKRLDKDPSFTTACKALCEDVTKYMLQNSTIDMFEDYFQGEHVTHQMQQMHTSTVAVFKDPVGDTDTRHITKICWHPEGPNRFCASYSILRFQRMDDSMPRNSFIWDVDNPNMPAAELNAQSPLICAAYQPKNVDLIAGGSYNGLITHYDLRVGNGSRVATTKFENSHFDPVYDLVWLQSKTQSECVTVSSDAKVLWWDIRNLKEPTDKCVLTNGDKDAPKNLGGTSIEWSQEAGPTKYLVGTEQGAVLALNKKPKKDVETSTWFGIPEKGGGGPHHGPVYKVRRNPSHCKFFMTVGDWCAKIWLEELKSPILQTATAPAYLTCGGWSPTRAGLFYTCRQDGFIDFYDYYYRMNEVAYTHKVSDAPLLSASMQSQGKLLAVGDGAGTVNLLDLCDELWQTSSHEKIAIGHTFDRETKREKNLEAIKKASGRQGVSQETSDGQIRGVDEQQYIERERAWHKTLDIRVEDKDLTINCSTGD